MQSDGVKVTYTDSRGEAGKEVVYYNIYKMEPDGGGGLLLIKTVAELNPNTGDPLIIPYVFLAIAAGAWLRAEALNVQPSKIIPVGQKQQGLTRAKK